MAKIRVGIVGASLQRGWATTAHIPALRALADDYEIAAVSTTRQESADAVAQHYGIPHAFASARDLANHKDVDVVAVTVKVPDHFALVSAALDAGKHVYCEWPLGRTTDEAERLLALAKAKGVQHVVGLQGRASPINNYVRDLVADGYVGKVLTVNMIGSAANWGATLDRAFQADKNNGANLLTIGSGHALDVMCYCLGEFRETSAFVVSQRERIPIENTNETVPLTSPDQIVASGIMQGGAVFSFHMRGGMRRNIGAMLEIHGETGDIVVQSPASLHQHNPAMTLRGAQGRDGKLAELTVPDKYRWVPAETPTGSPYNVAQMYMKLADSIRTGKPFQPGFAEAIVRHKQLDTIQRASDTGQKQIS